MQQHKDFRLRLPKFISHVHQASQDLERGDFFRGKLKRFCFYGIQSIEAIFVEGTASSEHAPAIKEKAITHAKEVAKRF